MKQEKRVSAWELAAFAAPAAPLLALTLPTVMFLPPHFIEHVGLDEAVVGLIFLGARLFDIVLDPMLGSLQDRTETRWGRRRVWLAACTPFLMAFIWWVFIALPPGASVAGSSAAVFLMYFVFAAMMVAHLSWSGEIVPTYHGRTRSLGAVQAASLVGQTIMLVMAGVVVQVLGGGNADAVQAMGWVLIVMLPLTVAIACFGARERRVPPQPHLSVRKALATLVENKVVRRVLIPDLLLGVSQGVSGGLFLFYFQYILGFVREAQTLAAIYFVAGLIGVPIWWTLGRKLGKHRALQAAFLYTAATTALLLVLPPGAFTATAAFMIAAGLAQGGCILLSRAMMADVVDEDEVRTGSRRSGLYFGLLLLTSKVGLAAGPLAFVALQLAGFSARLGADNTPQAMAVLAGLFIGVPILLCVLATLNLRKYPLDEAAQTKLHAAIEARHAANSENTLGPSTK